MFDWHFKNGNGNGHASGRANGASRFLRRAASPRPLCAIDIGTTKLCAMIGYIDENGHRQILGLGVCRSRGVRQGEVIDIDRTVEGMLNALSQAEGLARMETREVVVGIAGGHITCAHTEDTIPIPHSRRGVDERDRRRLVERALRRLTHSDDQQVLYHVPQYYMINGKRNVLNPLGLSAHQLGVRLHVALASRAAINNIVRCVRRANLHLRGIALESLASALTVLSDHEKKMGVAMLDIGGGTTDLAVFKNGCVQISGEIPWGGDSVTNDIHHVWDISFDDAEQLKRRMGTALPMSLSSEDLVDLPSPNQTRRPERKRRRELAEIIEARTEEILRMARQMVERDLSLSEIRAGLVLTGGTAMLHGIDRVAERVFSGLKCRIGFPRGLQGMTRALESPIYSTGVGLLQFAQEENAMLNGVSAVSRWKRWLDPR